MRGKKRKLIGKNEGKKRKLITWETAVTLEMLAECNP